MGIYLFYVYFLQVDSELCRFLISLTFLQNIAYIYNNLILKEIYLNRAICHEKLNNNY